MSTELVIVGAGGHGRELWFSVRGLDDAAAVWDLLGFVDDGDVDLARLERLGAPLLGAIDWLMDRPVAYALGIGTSTTRRTVVDRLVGSPAVPATIVAAGASVGTPTSTSGAPCSTIRWWASSSR